MVGIDVRVLLRTNVVGDFFLTKEHLTVMLAWFTQYLVVDVDVQLPDS